MQDVSGNVGSSHCNILIAAINCVYSLGVYMLKSTKGKYAKTVDLWPVFLFD